MALPNIKEMDPHVFQQKSFKKVNYILIKVKLLHKNFTKDKKLGIVAWNTFKLSLYLHVYFSFLPLYIGGLTQKFLR